jgi:hypothetical protein
MPSTSDLLNQLNALLRLTNTEIMIAETRRAQATTSDFERELATNADKARERSRWLADEIRLLGGAPDVTGMFVGRLAATTKAAVEQGQDIVEALLGDLGLEHELLDRTRYAKMVADQLAERRAGRVLERLEFAHSATLEWLMTRLAEVAAGGPVALRPSPTQAVAGFGRRVGMFPAGRSAAMLNQSVERASRLRDQAGEFITVNIDRTRQLAEAAGSIWAAGRDASLQRTEQIAEQRGDRETARRINRTRRQLGAVDATELPIRRYDALNADTAITRVRGLTRSEDVQSVLAYETANKARKSVVAAARDRFEELAADAAAAS